MTSLSGLVVSLGVAAVPSVVTVQFEVFFLLPISIYVALSGEAVLVRAWAARVAPAPFVGAFSSTQTVGTGVDNYASSG